MYEDNPRKYDTDKFMVAIDKDGKFLYLHETPSTTTPYKVDSPYKATKIYPSSWNGIDHPITYWFEDSDRMRKWLEGYRMTICFMQITTIYELSG